MPTSRLYAQGDFRRSLKIPERPLPAWRSPFRRDYARLIHSAAFRRLQGKTQLFSGAESEFFRNRLTHSIEVAQIAKTIAAKLNYDTLDEQGLAIDLDLVECAALAHDLGHPPFGHTGEDALDELMTGNGGFEGNAQTLRILARTEKKLDDPEVQLFSGGGTEPRWFDERGMDVSFGLNLCRRTLASVLKYDREIPECRGETGVVKGYYASDSGLVDEIRNDVSRKPVNNGEFKTIECQIMDLADDIAYSTYDIEDAFKSGLLSPLDLLFAPSDVKEAVAQRCAQELKRDFPRKEVTEVLQRLFPAVTEPKPDADFWENLGRSHRASTAIASRSFIRGNTTAALVDRAIRATTVDVNSDNPPMSQVRMDPVIRSGVAVLKHLVYSLLIRSPKMTLVARRGKKIVKLIFTELSDPKHGPTLLPADWVSRFEQAPEERRPRIICDFIAGMTDRHAVDFYARLTSSTYKTMFGLH